jgi:hypothetical protein
MKDLNQPDTLPLFPKRIRTYLTFNLVLAVVMAIVMAVRTELKTGRFLLIDLIMFGFYSLVLSSLVFGPLVVVELYLHRRKKGVFYAWRHRTVYLRRQTGMSDEEHRHRKSEAYRARLSQGAQAEGCHSNRTRLFEDSKRDDRVSRAALLMIVADAFERSGKREAAERCYLQITQRFADSSQAREAARRLASTLSKV